MLAPICLFTFNRLDETRETIQALQQNFLASESDLIIYSDGGKIEGDKKVAEVRRFLKKISGFKSIQILESTTNRGLARSIIDGVTNVLEGYGKVIVLEDDLITSPNFLSFMNQALVYYSEVKEVQSINGYSLPVKTKNNDIYFQMRTFSWGWATWEDRWNEEIFDKEPLKEEIESNPHNLKLFERSCGNDVAKMLKDSVYGRNNSWYIRWTYDHFKKGCYSVYPSASLVENAGFNSDGTHCTGIGAYNFPMVKTSKLEFQFHPFQKPQKSVTKEFLYFFTLRNKLFVRLKLLKTKQGRKLLREEVRQCIN